MKYPCPKCGIKLDKRGGWKHEKHCDGNQPSRRQSGVAAPLRGVGRTGKRKQPAAHSTAATPALMDPAERVNAAVRSLGRALVDFVLAEIEQSLQSSVTSLSLSGVAAPLRGDGRVPEKKQPAAGTAAATPDSLHSLSDQQLKDRLGVAKAANNIGLASKILNVLKMRDRSATVIANSAEVEA